MRKTTGVLQIGLQAVGVLALIFGLFTGKKAGALASSCKHTSTRFNCVEFVDNYDGDSITFNISKIHLIIGDNIKVRLLGVNTAEMKSPDSCERDVAYQAQAYVQNELSRAKRIDLVNIGRGKYFRVLADVIYDKKSLADNLLRRRLAVRYGGGTKPSIDWCD